MHLLPAVHSLADLQLDYLDLYLIHWPFPNHHAPGVDVTSRDHDAQPYIHENYMKTWRQLEKLVDLGLVRNIGTSNMTVPKLKLLLRDARIKPAANEMELHPHFQQPELFDFVCANGIEPIGYSPIGSPGRPERDQTADDTVDIEDPVIVEIAAAPGRPSGRGLHQVGRAAGPDADPLLDHTPQLSGQPACSRQAAADRRGDGRDRRHRQELPSDQGPGLPLERRPGLGRPVGRKRRNHASLTEKCENDLCRRRHRSVSICDFAAKTRDQPQMDTENHRFCLKSFLSARYESIDHIPEYICVNLCPSVAKESFCSKVIRGYT